MTGPLVNRFGLSFVPSKRAALYFPSKREWKSYYKHTCTRCGWAFCKPRHLAHRLDDCNRTLALRVADPAIDALCCENLGVKR